jgi:hypothetical protein
MSKEKRLEVRIDPGLKVWFFKYAATRGGMSKIIIDYIKRLKRREQQNGRTPSET